MTLEQQMDTQFAAQHSMQVKHCSCVASARLHRQHLCLVLLLRKDMRFHVYCIMLQSKPCADSHAPAPPLMALR